MMNLAITGGQPADIETPNAAETLAAGSTGSRMAASRVAPSEEGLMRIGDMAKLFGVTLRTLRFYEDKGLLAPQRDGPVRLYSHRDRVRLKLILLGRKVGFSLRDVKQMIDLYDPTGTNIRQLRLTLEKAEKQFGRLQKQRAAIDEAIDELSQGIADVRSRLSGATSAKN